MGAGQIHSGANQHIALITLDRHSPCTGDGRIGDVHTRTFVNGQLNSLTQCQRPRAQAATGTTVTHPQLACRNLGIARVSVLTGQGQSGVGAVFEQIARTTDHPAECLRLVAVELQRSATRQSNGPAILPPTQLGRAIEQKLASIHKRVTGVAVRARQRQCSRPQLLQTGCAAHQRRGKRHILPCRVHSVGVGRAAQAGRVIGLVVGTVAQRTAAEGQITCLTQGPDTGGFQHTGGQQRAAAVGVGSAQAQHACARLFDLTCSADGSSHVLSRTRIELENASCCQGHGTAVVTLPQSGGSRKNKGTCVNAGVTRVGIDPRQAQDTRTAFEQTVGRTADSATQRAWGVHIAHRHLQQISNGHTTGIDRGSIHDQRCQGLSSAHITRECDVPACIDRE